MLKGMRVVRGPDWKWGDQDGGIGCVGTVVPCQSKEITSGAWVRWDSGKSANYRAGSTKFDLRIFDSATLGVVHPNVACDACNHFGVTGIRWKCLHCHDYNLCHTCYHEGKHDLNHAFSRIDANEFPGENVSPRAQATKCKVWGIFPGARVVRGPDWEWKDQDGGDGTVGTVSDMDKSSGSYRSWVKVQWPSETTNSYRVGKDGKMDLRYTERETIGEFYIEHLPELDVTKVRPYVDSGDNVRLLDLTRDKLKELQTMRCGWSDEIANLRGKVGEVTVVDKDGDIKVKFGESSFFINPLCLVMEKKKNADTGKKEVKDLKGLLSLLVNELSLADEQEQTGGSLLFNAAANGHTDEVKEIIKKSPTAIKFRNSVKQTPLQVAAYRGHMDAVIALVAANSPLDDKDEDGDTALMFAVIGKEPDIMKYLLLSGSDINATNNNELSPLHLAIAKGHLTCAEVLLNHEPNRCNVNLMDKDGNSPLAVAVMKENQQIIQMLIRHPQTDLKMLNRQGFNSLHFASIVGNPYAVEKILEVAPDMINLQKDDGFTALHIAALNNHNAILKVLAKRRDCNKDIKNVNGQTALHLAINKCYNKCIEALVNNGANVNAQDKDGDTSLHLVMMKASMKDILGNSSLGQLMGLIQLAGNGGSSSDEKSNLVAIASYLIKNDADINIRNKAGNDVIDVTVNPTIKNILREHYTQKRTAARENEPCKIS